MNPIKSQYIREVTHQNQMSFEITHPKFNALISAYGGQLLSFTPKSKQDLLWLSDSAIKDGSKAIRGGIPICWPWFGPAPSNFTGEPQHGYLRNLNWHINVLDESEHSVKVVLELNEPETIKSKLGLTANIVYVLSDSAEVQLITTNINDKPFALAKAIHTYFNIEDITKTSIDSLKNTQYIDKLANSDVCEQTSRLYIDKAMDRVYLFNESHLTIDTEQRLINIESTSHDSVVVWTPWKEGANALADFDNDGYLNMLCVETALTQGYELQAGETYVLTQRFSSN